MSTATANAPAPVRSKKQVDDEDIIGVLIEAKGTMSREEIAAKLGMETQSFRARYNTLSKRLDVLATNKVIDGIPEWLNVRDGRENAGRVKGKSLLDALKKYEGADAVHDEKVTAEVIAEL